MSSPQGPAAQPERQDGSPPADGTGDATCVVEQSPGVMGMLPTPLQRYRVIRELGKGGFGNVLLAEDGILKRRVALKLLRRPAADAAASSVFLNEARLLARMDHPGIMPIYDAVETDDGRFCIVSRFVDGMSLARKLAGGRLSRHESAEVIAMICKALGHAHQHGVVHLDVKPGNIILTTPRTPVLLDFGIARLLDSFSATGHVSGTPAYMSPEQARGEDHLVDGRSDIFSAGAVLYEMLTGQRAWVASTPEERMHLTRGELIPPRRIDASIPRELERICLKALQLKPRDRYATAVDMAADMEEWLAGDSQTVVIHGAPPSQEHHSVAAPATTMVPRGLRAYDECDTEFFLQLLPGPRDRNGLPESVRSWKQRLESRDGPVPRVCVLYGPSGSGKSSFLRAAVIPRLSGYVHTVRLDAGSATLTGSLIQSIRTLFPEVPDGTEAGALLQSIRQGAVLPHGHKLLLIVDQSEQWLHSDRRNSATGDDELVAILRQCDGIRVQALLVVRDDFWRGLTLLLAEADTAADAENSALMDLFDVRHAERVLELSGRALGVLPADTGVAMPEQAAAFVKEAAAGLAEHGQVSPARLALFTQMWRTREWTPESLREIGGTINFGAAFLEDAFNGAGAGARQRLHEQAARAVLRELTPESGDVRGAPVPDARLLEVSGYAGRPAVYRELMSMLDHDLRLIIPVETGRSEFGWQIVHDQLVPGLRVWMHMKQASTLRGRAGIRLTERAAEYARRKSSHAAPGVGEWLWYRCLTKPAGWSDAERKFMARGVRKAALTCMGGIALTVAGGFGLREIRGQADGRAIAASISAASGEDIMRLTREAIPSARWVVPALKKQPMGPGAEGLRSRIALLAMEKTGGEQVAEAMLAASPGDFGAACDAFKDSGVKLPHAQWDRILSDNAAPASRRLRALAGLCRLAPSEALKSHGTAAGAWLMLAGSEAPGWAPYLAPIAESLAPVLTQTVASAGRAVRTRSACATLAALYRGNALGLAGLLAVIPATELEVLRDELLLTGPRGLEALKSLLETIPAPAVALTAATPEARKAYTMRAHAAVLLAALGAAPEHGGFTLRRTPDRTERTLFTLACAPAGVAPASLANRLAGEVDPGVRFALLTALAGFRPADLPGFELDQFLGWLRNAWLNDPDGGCHSAIRWIFTQYGLDAEGEALDKALPRTPGPKPGFSWWVTKSGVDMRVIQLPSGQSISVAALEYAGPGNPYPAGQATWFMAVETCLKLNVDDGLPEESWAYKKAADGIAISQDIRRSKGYRLPTAHEWLAGSMAGALTTCESGAFPEFLKLSAWLSENSGETVRPGGQLRPADSGVFDAFGNLAEWLHEARDNDENMGTLAGRRFLDSLDSTLQDHFRPYDPQGRIVLPGFGFRLVFSQ